MSSHRPSRERAPRWRWRAAATGVTVAGLVLSSGVSAVAGPAVPLSNGGPTTPTNSTAPTPSARPGVAGTVTITLVTGDTVTYGFTADGTPVEATAVAARRPDGRPVLFSRVREGAAYYVYPSDAADLVAAGKLDKRLFDVAYLAKNGYTDDKAKNLPVIVQYGGARRDANTLTRAADALPATSTPRALPTVGAATVRVDKAKAADFWSAVDAPKPGARTLDSGVAKVWLDGRATATLDESVPQIGAPEVWAAGYTGAGVTVAVLDTGIDATHPDLAGKVADARNFVDGGDPGDVTDGNGHGTHVASTIVGSGAASGGRYKGVAPDATLYVGKVLDDQGNGSDSSIIAGMQWAAAEKHAKVVSISIGGCCTDGTDPMSQAVNDLSAQYGTLFVIAAGNDGAPVTIETPGAADAALTVGAVDKQDRQAPFASQGPRLGDYGLKPDLTAPGVGITAALADGTSLAPPVDGRYMTISGTSMATPHVSGSAALLAQEHPDWTGAQLKGALVSSTKDVGGTAYEQGSGRLDAARASRQGVYASGNVDFATIAFPQTGPVERTLTYTNTTDQPVTLDLTATVAALRGTAKDGTLSVNPRTVTVPAHGTAPVTVTFDPKGPATWYQGAVEATSGDLRIRSAVGAYQQPRRHVLTARLTMPAGATDVLFNTWFLLKLDDEGDINLNDNLLFAAGGTEIAGRLDEGTYSINTAVNWRDANGDPQVALLTRPQVEVAGDTTITFDVAAAQKVDTRTPKPTVRHQAEFGYNQLSAGGGRAYAVTARVGYGDDWGLWATPTEPVTVGSFVLTQQELFAAAPVAMSARTGRSGSTALHPRYLTLNPNVAKFDGRRRLPVVDAGHGLPEDLAGVDVRGALALIDLSDLCRPDSYLCDRDGLDRLAAARAAGAAGVLVFGAVGRPVLPVDFDSTPEVGLPLLTLPAGEGRALLDALARRAVAVDVSGAAAVSYVYSLSYPNLGGIPASLRHSVDSEDLYEITSRYHGDAPGVVQLGWNSAMKSGAGAGSSQLNVRGPSTLTEYVGPLRGDVTRGRGAAMTYDAPESVDLFNRTGYIQSRADVFERPGRRTDDFGAQPLVQAAPSGARPEQTDNATCQACRSGQMFVPQHIVDSDGTHGGLQTWYAENVLRGQPQTELHLYRADGTEVPQKTGAFVIFIAFFLTPYYMLPDEPGQYRMTEKYLSPFVKQRFARTVDTAWTFTSATPTTGWPYRPPAEQGVHCAPWFMITADGTPKGPCQANPQLYLGYNLGLDLDNTLPAGRSQKITVNGYHHSFGDTDPELTTLALSVSFDDGKRWQPLRTTKSGRSEYTATIDHPKLERTSGAVSIRARGVDTAGNTVEQTITRAYGLRPAGGGGHNPHHSVVTPI